MALVSWCPQCPAPVALDPAGGAGYFCDSHGEVVPLWRPVEPDYRSFTEALAQAGEVPTYLPWPLSPGWTVSDFGCVPGAATVTSTAGTSSLDGDVEVTLVVEEPRVGLGARCAGLAGLEPSIGEGPATVRARFDQRPVSLWPLASGADDDVLARSVFVGEAGGRWIWLVMRPASAALLLRDEWLFADAGRFGPEAVEVPFGGSRPPW